MRVDDFLIYNMPGQELKNGSFGPRILTDYFLEGELPKHHIEMVSKGYYRPIVNGVIQADNWTEPRQADIVYTAKSVTVRSADIDSHGNPANNEKIKVLRGVFQQQGGDGKNGRLVFIRENKKNI